MMLHTYTPQQMSLPCTNFLHLMVSEIQPRQTFSRRPPTCQPIGTPRVKTITLQPLKAVGLKLMILSSVKINLENTDDI